ncbi:MAG: Lrp/AsnC family transcriptional regulator [Desulfovibrionaceae bacterium]
MVNAIVLMKVDPRKVNEVAEAVASLSCVSEAFSVGGRFDVAAIVRAKDNEALADTVTRQFLAIEGIVSSETLIAFKAFSRYDMERMFDME